MHDTREPIEVRRYGHSGPALLVLHGGPGAPGSAAGLALALAPSFRVHEPLQRRSGSVPLSVAVHVDDLAQVAPAAPTLVVGHSWGAMLALSYAVKYPERVSALVLVGCGTYGDKTRAQYRERMHAVLAERGQSTRFESLRARLASASDEPTRDALRAELARAASEIMIVEACEPSTQDAVDARANTETWEDVERLQREGHEPAAFTAIQAPVLMLHGDDDPHPGLATRDLLKRVLPQLEYRGFAACGHEPWRERHAREPFLQALVAWLQQHS